MKDLMLIPRVSEKAYGLSQKDGAKTYVFQISTTINKQSIARAIATQYDVVVTNVRTSTSKGKHKQSYRKGGRPITGVRSDFKKAYVTLRAGDSLPLFVEEAAEEAKQTKVEEKATKKAKKEKK